MKKNKILKSKIEEDKCTAVSQIYLSLKLSEEEKIEVFCNLLDVEKEAETNKELMFSAEKDLGLMFLWQETSQDFKYWSDLYLNI